MHLALAEDQAQVRNVSEERVCRGFTGALVGCGLRATNFGVADYPVAGRSINRPQPDVHLRQPGGNQPGHDPGAHGGEVRVVLQAVRIIPGPAGRQDQEQVLRGPRTIQLQDRLAFPVHVDQGHLQIRGGGPDQVGILAVSIVKQAVFVE